MPQPPPLSSHAESTPAVLQLRSLADITNSAVQRRWHHTLDRMERAPDADIPALNQVRSWITHGVTLDFESSPSQLDFDNTFTVYQHASEVRTRITEYIAFGRSFDCLPTTSVPSASSRYT